MSGGGDMRLFPQGFLQMAFPEEIIPVVSIGVVIALGCIIGMAISLWRNL